MAAVVMSRKRSRALADGIDINDGAGRNSRDKRPRRATSDSSDKSSNDEQSNAASDNDDASDHEGEHFRRQEAWATQQVQKDYETDANKQNTANECGIIEEIQCINFMCHEHLTVTLGPLINFIIGHNGSGKSAVLTALTICLGGKATATNRAQNLKSLIKEGKDHAIVTVRVKNQGSLAYKPNEYGNSIIVERHFSRSGTSGFKLKDENGKMVTHKKAELEDILDAFSLQIDNPMNVLTQDMARQFLNNSTPKDKYKFFLQGTQLENLSRDYQQVEQLLELINARTELNETSLGDLRKQMVEKESKARRAQSLQLMRAKETVMAKQTVWAEVEEMEADLAKAVAQIAKADAAIQNQMQAEEEASERYERADQAYEAATQSVTVITTETEPAKEAEMDAKTKFLEAKDKILLLMADIRRSGSDVKARKEYVQKYEADIKQHRQRQAEADNGLYAEKQRERDEAKEESTQAEQALKKFDAQDTGLRELQDALQTAQREMGAADQAVKAARAKEEHIQRNIRVLRRDQRDWMDAYPNPKGLAGLLKAIEAEKRFREKPVGPMGHHVKLLRPEWGYILEKQSGQAMNAFVVTSKADQATLSKLMKDCRWHSSIYIGNRNHINTEQNEPNPALLTWMNALNIEDPLVRNQLIINQRIEQVVLFEDQDEALTFMHARGQAATNVIMCFTFSDDNHQKGRVINYTSNGGINNSPIGVFTGNLRMQADKEDEIRGEESRLKQVQKDLGDLEEKYSKQQDQVKSCKRRQQDHSNQRSELVLIMQGASDRLGQLEDELNAATPDAAAIEVLEEALETARTALVHAEGVFEDIMLQKCELDEVQKLNKKELEKAQAEVTGLDLKLEKALTTVRKLQGRREDLLRRKNDVITEVTRAKADRVRCEEERDHAQKEVEGAIEAAKSVCPERVEIPPGKTAQELHNTLRRLEATRKQAEEELGGSQDELLQQALEAKKAHEVATQELRDNKCLRSHLINALTHRRNRWSLFRSGISVRARVTFNYLLSERKFRGSLIIDHQKALLDLQVQPDSMERSGDGRQTKTLSGGEKSYSTVCLLLSLWDAMGSPIRCLDEFDVFMDSVNRERSMHMIIQAARRSVGRQFIFITPQSMNNVNQTSDVKIIKMSDPERGQTALNVSRN
ncbi:P-loop containing nucleoside triphosphate hydrolase protein [Clathrospora elynae]|uniref:P-loop containing nucleoside triphosphate hydrolase protein n=1 Tax=Clathrospora elynae TaxID=706981 RepID=A0A6A5T2D5_9PLEO|nr:P-loop containing nucleoside triphosphate hydrolase protein [Clathrospora elynae]